MVFKYICFSISIAFMSFIIGMIMTSLIRKIDFYAHKLSHLNFVKNETTNKIMGVGVVKWIVKNTFFKFFNQNLKIHRRVNLTDLRNIRNEMTKSEIDHLFAFVAVIIFVIVKIFNQEYLFAFIIFMVNIIMNLYPSLLQQQNKRRIDKLIARYKC